MTRRSGADDIKTKRIVRTAFAQYVKNSRHCSSGVLGPVIVPLTKCPQPKTPENWLAIKVTCSPGAYYRNNNLRKPKGWRGISTKLLFASPSTELFYKQCLQQ